MSTNVRPGPGPSESPSIPAAAPPSSRSRSVFVGREQDLGQLLGGLEEAFAGRGRLFLVSGEPGIGKSRLSDELASRARDGGARVLWGRCWEAGGAPAYWPWVQAIRTYLRDLDPQAIRSRVGSGAPELAQIVPEVGESLPGFQESSAADPDAARFRLFESVATLLRNAALDTPLVLVLDDLHAADTPSLLLLRFMAGQLPDARILLLATYRDVHLSREPDLAAGVADLERERVTEHIRLTGLPRDDVRRFIELSTAVIPSDPVVAAVHRESEGNPLFMGELVRLLAAEGKLQEGADPSSIRLRIPQSVREVIVRRLAHLSVRCRSVLAVASVLGREFTLEALAQVSGTHGDELLAVVDEAAAAGVITDVPGSLGRLRFSHALVRDALYDEIPATRRFLEHRRAGEALEALYAADPGPHLAELAHHFVEAAAAGDRGRAIDYARRAAQWAMERLAFEESVRLYRMALEVLDRGARADPALRCELLLALGDAQAKAGDGPGAKEMFSRAVDLAREEGLPEHLARGALGYGGQFVWNRPGSDIRVLPLLREGIAALPQGDSPLRVMLLSRLAGALRDQPSRTERDRVSDQAMAMARRLGDHRTLAYALIARFTAIWGPDNTQELVQLAAEVIELGERTGDRDLAAVGHMIRHKALLTLGEMEGVRADMEMAEKLAEEQRQPGERWYPAADRATLALFEGRFDEAERLVEEAHRLGARAQGNEAEWAYRLQLFGLRREQGRLHEVEELIRKSVYQFPWYPMFRCALANLYAHMDREADARRVFEELAADDFGGLPMDNQWLFAMCLLPEVAASLGDRPRAELLHGLLLPFAALNANTPPELCLGSVGRYLGIAAATAGRLEEAERHFARAIERNTAMGARPFVAHVQHDLARTLLARDGPGDRERAAELLGASLETAAELGIPVLQAKAAKALERLGVAPPVRPEAAILPLPSRPGRAPQPVPYVFRREADVWEIAYEGRSFRLRDRKGLRYVHELLRHPGQELHVLQLTGAAAPTGSGPTSPLGPQASAVGGLVPDTGHAGDVLDAQARTSYQRRIEDLREEIEEATRWGDTERQAKAREELDFISRELAAAFGIGGRPRQAADSVERVRKAVTNRIRDAIGLIGREHPVLARHLMNCITTGNFCSYTPDRPIRWRL